MVGKLEGTKVNLEIDISTGDKVTPRELKYKYPLTFEDRSILINSYNIETILAEKIETVLRRGTFNSRMKDYYDIYFFLTRLKKDLDINILKMAIKNTFTKRDSFGYLNDYKQILDAIKNNERTEKLWNTYSKKYNYAGNIKFINILSILEEFIDELEIEVVAI